MVNSSGILDSMGPLNVKCAAKKAKIGRKTFSQLAFWLMRCRDALKANPSRALTEHHLSIRPINAFDQLWLHQQVKWRRAASIGVAVAVRIVHHRPYLNIFFLLCSLSSWRAPQMSRALGAGARRRRSLSPPYPPRPYCTAHQVPMAASN